MKNAQLPGSHFHEDRTINVASRVFTRINVAPSGSHVLQDIIGKKLLTKFLDDQTKTVASKPNIAICGRMSSRLADMFFFQANGTIFKLKHDYIGTNLLTKFHDDVTLNTINQKNAGPSRGHVFQPTGAIFDLMKIGQYMWPLEYIIGTNILTKNLEDRPPDKNAPPQGGHVCQETTNLFTKFHEDRTINVASGVLTMQMLTPHDARRTKGDHKSSP
ncbi:hypothetical protein DPMN_059228 [Dreissena polymorpha]|uniref:Uncharacterized protein n=1 Tax=Dreissena polymorpha TaxID=45954 RepID=A0A9D4C3N0_DREPO|nr:hypothetical protein DPMN_059228 [Dreissena polymorpha]